MRAHRGQIGTDILNLPNNGADHGNQSRNVFTAAALVIPKQTATSDSCTMIDEEDIVSVTGPEDIVLGWVRRSREQALIELTIWDADTHPSQADVLPEQPGPPYAS